MGGKNKIGPHARKTFINFLFFWFKVEFIQLKEVGKSFGTNNVLENVNLIIQEGDIFGIIGQSGSGKTTLLNLIAGFLEPSEGEVMYFSKVDHTPKNLHQHFHKIKKHIGFTPQHSSFYPKLTVKENLLHFGKLYGIERSPLMENAESLLEFTELHEHQNKLAEHLSGGMQKRLDLSCSLVHKPKLLILDEPTANLDPLTQEEIIHLIQEVNKQGVTIVIASHQLETMERLCNKLVIIHHGSVRSQGEVDEVLKPLMDDAVVINVSTGKEKEKLIEIIKKLPVTKIIDQGHQLVLQSANPELAVAALIKIARQENLHLHDVDLRKPSLREILTKITQEVNASEEESAKHEQ